MRTRSSLPTLIQTVLVVGNLIPADFLEDEENAHVLFISPVSLQSFVSRVPDTIRVLVTYGPIDPDHYPIMDELAYRYRLSIRSTDSIVMLKAIVLAYKGFQPGLSIEFRPRGALMPSKARSKKQ